MAEEKDKKKDLGELDTDIHIISIPELESRLGTSVKTGLDDSRIGPLQDEFGLNRLKPARVKPGWMVFWSHLFSGFALLLWIAAFLCLVGFALQPAGQENLYLGMVLIIVVTVTAVFSYSQDAKAAAVMEGFKDMTPQMALVTRGGKEQTINALYLVPGDLVRVKFGDIIPADIRIIESSGLKVDNSSLTGENEPQPRAAEMTHERAIETRNLAFSGTMALEGSAVGVVVLTADNTVIGKIAALATAETTGKTPIRLEIEHFIHIISTIAIILGIIFFMFGLVVYDFITNVVFTIGIIVANVPEGLLATVTVALTLTSLRMKDKKVLVKNLESVETLGSTSVICSDKTGTLTQNRMTCVNLWHDRKVSKCVTPGNKVADYDESSGTFQAHVRCMALCNNSVFEGNPENMALPVLQRKCTSDASETAIFKMTTELDIFNRDVEGFRQQNDKLHEIPFASKNKYQVSIHKIQGKSQLLLCMKGAPERIVARCSTIMINGVEEPMTDEMKQVCNEANEDLCKLGERVLGFCEWWMPESFDETFVWDKEEPNFPLEGFCFLGLCGLIDPPRAAVPEAVRTCQAAGIKVVMVTGDHPATAKAIAKQVNIISSETKEDFAARTGRDVSDVSDTEVDSIVITGMELRDYEDSDLDQVLNNYSQIVFARTSPQQKLQIVEGFQRRGDIVAVTGDGVNDSPALKKADIGVAMGITGSDVSKNAADMILLDDNFASIVRGVEEGRLIFDNLKKSIAYTLSSNIPEILPFILFILIQIPLPLSTVLILCVDIGTDLIPAISLAYETAENDIMLRMPRNAKTDKLVTPRLISFSYLQIGVIQAAAGMYTYFVVMGDFGFPPLSLIFQGNEFDRKNGTDATIVYAGQATTLEQRINALGNAQTAYFVSIVVVQWADLLACKTRKLSLFQQGMKNMVLNFGLFSETLLAIFLCYCPFLDIALGTRPIHPRHWLPALPFTLLILSYDELRKFTIREFPGGWVETNTYY
eukprot:TRINITY_DN16016_c0_g1_i1.p1 TRINITY_DN16016_c0_g1~~TRINITY_DN16016_c0_g1_i1.p1  ORF type:complete len:993 (-),score=365.00 TRINITY_DN16016_c0_g1_i1:185-3163(-)